MDMEITLTTNVSRRAYPDDTLKLRRDGDMVVLTFNHFDIPVDQEELTRALRVLTYASTKGGDHV